LTGQAAADANGLEEATAVLAPRERRKLHSFLDTGKGKTWWAPGAIGWWIGVLFAIGATLFALGAAPGFFNAVGGTTDAIVYFIGSIFFTTAALLMYVEAVNAGRQRFRFFAWEPRDLAFWASLVQLFGTIYFNHSTFAAINSSLNSAAVDHLVWKPDILGSICFLIASFLAWGELGRVARAVRPRTLSWWIVYLNIAGSFAFGVSGVAAFVVPTTGSDVNKALVNLGTFVGGLCFLAAAILLLPERTKESLG
jgi:hypothetical protein